MCLFSLHSSYCKDYSTKHNISIILYSDFVYDELLMVITLDALKLVFDVKCDWETITLINGFRKILLC